MGLQVGLLLLGLAVFLLILLDALRRKRAALRRQAVDDQQDPDEQVKREQIARELPSIDDPEISKARKDLDPLFDDVEVFDDDPIPVLRNSVQLESEPTAETQSLHQSPDLQSAAPEDAMTAEHLRGLFARDPAFAEEAQRSAQQLQHFEQEELDALPDQDYAYEPADVDDLVDLEPHPAAPEPEMAEQPDPQPQPDPYTWEQEEAARQQDAAAYEAAQQEQEAQNKAQQLVALEQKAWSHAEEFITININACEGLPFEGYKLAYLMEMIGMRLSASGFFHYVEKDQGVPYLGYSLVNMFKPGTFDEASLNEFVTPGLVLVMALPNTRKPQAIFERMLETARVFERNWGAELQDEQRSNLTLQTIEHYRQRIQDFERKTRLKQIKAQKALQ